jgi:CcmD family protein
MADTGLEFLYAGYLVIALGWFAYVMFLHTKQNSYRKELVNLKNVVVTRNKELKKEHGISSTKDTTVIFPVIILVVILVIAAGFAMDDNEVNIKGVNEILENASSSVGKEIECIGIVDSITKLSDNSTGSMFSIKNDERDDKSQGEILVVGPEVQNLAQGQYVVVMGTLEQNNETFVLQAEEIKLGYPTDMTNLYFGYSMIWLLILIYLFFLHIDQSKLKAELNEINEMVIFHGKKGR